MSRPAKSLSAFVSEANVKHALKYDYSLAKYVNSNTKLTIICKKHGEFMQTPGNHLRGNGCKSCQVESFRLTAPEFVNRAHELHDHFYDYSKSIYIKGSSKIVIICPLHGEFTQSGEGHLQGYGCPECGGVKRHTTETFIITANNIHSNKYNYEKTLYTSNKDKVIISCPEHGDFTQIAQHHIRGCGCPSCGGVNKHTTESFIEAANVRHNYKYSYERSNYLGNRYKITITCPEHGDFVQTANSHLQGIGCSRCAKYGYDASKIGVLYIYDVGRFVGYGITTNLDNRDRQHQNTFKNFGLTGKIIYTYKSDGLTIQNLESSIKRHFHKSDNARGVEGFSRESVPTDKLEELLYFIEKELKVSQDSV